jgi:HK97 family phage major capsid protein
VTQSLLDDSDFDIGAFVLEEISREFTVQEGTAFVTGDGIRKPRGFLNYPTFIGAQNAKFGQIEAIKSGNAGGLAADPDGGDAIIDVLHAMKAAHRKNATWLMNSKTQAVVAKLKDSQGRYIWTTAVAAGAPDMLLGRPVALDENMPDIAANAFPIALGDWQQGYIINDRLGARILRDPYSNKPFVMFYATKRVGGRVLNSEAIKLLRVSA